MYGSLEPRDFTANSSMDVADAASTTPMDVVKLGLENPGGLELRLILN